MLPALLLACSAAPAASDELGARLAALASPRADERDAAQRWLEANLTYERYPDLARCALAGDAEVRGRLKQVLGSDSRFLSVALELCGERDPGLVALGRDAVVSAVAAADPALSAPGLRGQELEPLLRQAGLRGPAQVLRLDPGLPLARMVRQLQLCGDLPLGLTLDPRLVTREIRRTAEPLEASWSELVLRLAHATGTVLESHGLQGGNTSGNGARFLRLTLAQDPAPAGVDLIAGWLIGMVTRTDAEERLALALDLASSGFDPALEWLDFRVAHAADPAARAGLLVAAAGGRVGPSLLASGVLDALVQEAPDGPECASILMGLAHAGCFAAGGESLVTRLLNGFDAAGARAQWARLLLLERGGCEASAAVPRARALLAGDATPPALRLAAIRFLATQVDEPAPAPPATGLEALAGLALDAEDLERLGRSLVLLGLDPPFEDPARLPGDAAACRVALELWLWNGRDAVVARHLAAWMARAPVAFEDSGASLADGLRPWLWRGFHERVDGCLRAASALVPGREREIERVRLLLGLVPAREVPALLARGRYALESSPPDLPLLGALGGYPETIGAERAARERLVALLEGAIQESRPVAACEPLVTALERAGQGLFEARRDELGQAFAQDVRRLFRRSARSELAQRLFGGSDSPASRSPWPPAPAVRVRDLAHELARFEVPPSL